MAHSHLRLPQPGGGLVSASVRAQLPWLSPEGAVWNVEAGTYFDAIRVPRTIGLSAISDLDGQSGAVICDPWSRIMYFLTEPSSTRDWQVRETVPCGPATYVVVPPLDARETVLHWAVPPSLKRPFTPVDRLREVLQAIVDAKFGPGTEHFG